VADNQTVALSTTNKVGPMRVLKVDTSATKVLVWVPEAPAGAPIAVTLGNTNAEIGGLTISAAYAQAEVTALRDKTEELADDLRAMHAALVTAGILKAA
jgi:hypothetical protein